LAIKTRLTNSHSSSPPTTESVPARYLSRAAIHISVADLGDAGQEQPLGREARRQIAEPLEGFDQLAELAVGIFPVASKYLPPIRKS
jgi:hypothetical protein